MNLSLRFDIFGAHPFIYLDEDWVGMCDKIICISSGKPLELDLELARVAYKCKEDELCIRIMERVTSLLDYPNICTHLWNPTTPRYLLDQKLPFGEVRSKCRQ